MGPFADVCFFAFAGSLRIISIFMFMYYGSSERSSSGRTLVIVRRPVRRQPVLSSSWPSTWPPRPRSPSKHTVLGLLTHCICIDYPAPLLISYPSVPCTLLGTALNLSPSSRHTVPCHCFLHMLFPLPGMLFPHLGRENANYFFKGQSRGHYL